MKKLYKKQKIEISDIKEYLRKVQIPKILEEIKNQLNKETDIDKTSKAISQ